MVDRAPTMVFCYNRLLREQTDDEPAIYVGEAVAVRRAGRVTRVQGNYVFDEFADLCNSYDVENDQGALAARRGMKLWRFNDAETSQMRYSIVADAVTRVEFQGVSYFEWAVGGETGNEGSVGSMGSIGSVSAKTGQDATSPTLNLIAYAFYNLNRSAFEPPAWTIGDGYGFEFANVQLPHNFIFGNGALPSRVGDIGFVKAIYFDPEQYSDNDSVDVYSCRPSAGGSPTTRKAGTASSKEDTTI